MTSMQLAVAAGILLMTGPILLIAHYAPKHPALNAYLTATTHTPNILTETTIEADHWEDRLGLWLQRNLGGRLSVPKDELEILQVPIHKYLTRRALYALIGVSAPTLLSVTLWLMGTALPVGSDHRINRPGNPAVLPPRPHHPRPSRGSPGRVPLRAEFLHGPCVLGTPWRRLTGSLTSHDPSRTDR